MHFDNHSYQTICLYSCQVL